MEVVNTLSTSLLPRKENRERNGKIVPDNRLRSLRINHEIYVFCIFSTICDTASNMGNYILKRTARSRGEAACPFPEL